MKKLRKTNLRWWGIVLIMITQPAFSQLTQFPLPADMWLSRSEMTVFRDTLYMVVETMGRAEARLCKFDGSNFTTIPNPAGLEPARETPLTVYQGNLYFIMTDIENDPTIPPFPELFRFDGTTFTRMVLPPLGRIPSIFSHSDLKVYRDELYLDVSTSELNPVNAWLVYDGTDFTLVDFPFGMGDTGTSGMKVFDDRLFSMMKAPGGDTRLVNYNGTSFLVPIIPDLVETKAGVYKDKLIITKNISGVNQLSEIGGGSTADITSPSGVLPVSGGKEVYNGILYLAMDEVSTPSVGDLLMAYNGFNFTRIATIDGMRDDFEVWNGKLYINTSKILYSYQALTLPAYYDFEYVDLNLFTDGPGWCWKEVVVDWGMPPICLTPPNCPEGDSPIAISLMNKNKEIWRSIEKKPFALKIPECGSRYTFSLDIVKLGGPQNLITIDPNLVGMGVETIKLGLKPQQRTVNISLSTKENKAVPITISFLNEEV